MSKCLVTLILLEVLSLCFIDSCSPNTHNYEYLSLVLFDLSQLGRLLYFINKSTKYVILLSPSQDLEVMFLVL